jgi:hypothetical protein
VADQRPQQIKEKRREACDESPISQHYFASYQDVLHEHQAQQIGAESTRQKGTHQHVAIEENR